MPSSSPIASPSSAGVSVTTFVMLKAPRPLRRNRASRPLPHRGCRCTSHGAYPKCCRCRLYCRLNHRCHSCCRPCCRLNRRCRSYRRPCCRYPGRRWYCRSYCRNRRSGRCRRCLNRHWCYHLYRRYRLYRRSYSRWYRRCRSCRHWCSRYPRCPAYCCSGCCFPSPVQAVRDSASRAAIMIATNLIQNSPFSVFEHSITWNWHVLSRQI